MRCFGAFGISLTLGFAAGCIGSVNDDKVSSRDLPPGATPGGGTRGNGVPGQPPLVEDPGPGMAHLRRLTRREIRHTLADLFGNPDVSVDVLLPDGQVEGFESNIALSTTRADVEKYDALAVSVTEGVSSQSVAPCDEPQGQETSCVQSFLQTFGRRAFRRPLTAEETAQFVQLFEEKRADSGYGASVRLVLRAMLQSPHFIYHTYIGEPTGEPGIRKLTGYEVAERLSYALLGTTPSDALLDAAAAGELDTAEGVETHALRLLDDPRLAETLAHFHKAWLHLEKLESAQKDPVVYAAFTENVRAAAEEETERFVWEAFQADGGRLSTLLTGSFGFVNDELASLYGLPSVSGDALQRVDLNPNERAGLLTQLGFLAAHANFGQSSPIFRGVLVRERFLCQALPAPPPGLAVTEPDVDPNLPTRERFAAHRDDPACAGCHSLIDPIGFGFENYDGIGRFRTEDGGAEVDASGELTEAGDANGPFNGAVELSQRLANSKAVSDCLATQWFRYAVGRDETLSDHGTLEEIRETFVEGDLSTRTLLHAIAGSQPFRFVRSNL